MNNRYLNKMFNRTEKCRRDKRNNKHNISNWCPDDVMN